MGAPLSALAVFLCCALYPSTVLTEETSLSASPSSLARCDSPYNTSCCSSKKHCPSLKSPLVDGYRTLSLSETFAYLAYGGGSLARFGDGEIRAISGGHIVFEESTPELVRGLRFVSELGGSPESCLCVGTYPVLDANFSRFRRGKRRAFAEKIYRGYLKTWRRHMPEGTYCDSFVSRADAVNENEFSALEFFSPRWQSVFSGQRVLLIRGATALNEPVTQDPSVFERHLSRAQHVEQLTSFKSLDEHINLNTDSGMFKHYVGLRNEVLSRLESGKFDVAVLSLGATATVLAAELSCRGFRAIDVGQFGGNFEKI